ncbi:DUF3800 domain-containing protein [Aquirufa echingensis]|jgi:hypothetical protein|uniref:DUF3800 domain-containing protein n=1 Tax=Aquirufa echingensis TaxID=3096516 RepID=A0ABW6D0M1_9BACT
MKYYLFIDECGDHGLSKIDFHFPIFLLCGILISDNENEILKSEITKLKSFFWRDNSPIFHSRDIRKCANAFKILLDEKTKLKFYRELNKTLENHSYWIIPVGLNKFNYVKKYGNLGNDPYELCLSSVFDLCISHLKNQTNLNELVIVLEKRGEKEDNKLASHITKIISNGTYKNSAESFNSLRITFKFNHKKEGLVGLQIADLTAYPIAKYLLNVQALNPAFDIIAKKILQPLKKILLR